MRPLPYLPQLKGISALYRMKHVDRRTLEVFRIKQLRHLLRHAYSNVVYYRQLFDRAKVKPDDIRTIRDLSAIPLTTKRDLQVLQPKSRTAAGIKLSTLIARKTGGSTGEPLLILRSWYEERLLQSFRWRALQLLGKYPKDRMILINRVRAIDPNDKQFLLHVSNRLGLFRLDRIDCFLPLRDILEELLKRSFDILGGLALVLYHLAIEINKEGLKLHRPRFIFTGGELVTPNMRQEIEQAFNTRLYDFYGSHEFNLLAWQCKETGDYHVNDASVIVEIVKNGRASQRGERGEVIATSLFSYTMPFIRYRLGDIVVRGENTCSCGLAYSTIREIDGRAIDYLYLDGGRKIHPYQIIRFLVHTENPWVRQYQLAQPRGDHIILQVAPSRAVEPETVKEFKQQAISVLGTDTLFDLKLVDDIPREKSGKFKVFKSLYTPDKVLRIDGTDFPERPNNGVHN